MSDAEEMRVIFSVKLQIPVEPWAVRALRACRKMSWASVFENEQTNKTVLHFFFEIHWMLCYVQFYSVLINCFLSAATVYGMKKQPRATVVTHYASLTSFTQEPRLPLVSLFGLRVWREVRRNRESGLHYHCSGSLNTCSLLSECTISKYY